jgi:hypothetical protein
MNNSDKFIRVLRRELTKGNKKLVHLSAYALVFNWNMGYKEYAEHPELSRLAKPYACEYCGILHTLEDCPSSGVEEYRADPAAWKKKYLSQ